ncbi:Chaperone protein DnaJ [Apilactobacillus kunkeei]|uniref:Chaperone protein DnaJ n=2 Tax=Apilactobacillus kunkeei TaxID=148814 RepID=A0A087EP30_9LACO|nr:molecular chaperone DnaJ [Apilactobacillus kunkeei]MCL8494976.1 molecular chaperone DnaJ [Apilactobacillus sp. F1]MCT6857781.1 molecular chaperone DnaJ [Apilactobacillus sp.]ALJ31771.1 molecular chaperone DnaJ [Apilactobacillus kunkeei]KFJ15031.1 molecular chaperone DnaJ [Apilactobacillus kunkeei]KOY74260.1 Chaperone protein DnaJ [Apilactobacillus kunkeei]
MADKDYYSILGISKDASQDDIKHAYRRMSKKYHPDINKEPGAEKKFKEINEAYEVLSDEQKRRNYDQFGSADGPAGGFGGGAGGFGGGAGGFSGFGGGGFDDIFSQFFGGGARGAQRDPNAPVKGRDLQYQMTINFEDAVFGKKTTIRYDREAKCDTCDGSGAKPGTHPETCHQCNGSGYVTSVQNTPLGQMQTQHPCPTCGGTGKEIKDKCPKCGGSGHMHESHKVEVNIPAGVDDGQQMRLQGQGEAGENGGPYGDLFIVFRVKPSRDFERDGSDLHYSQNISFTQATLGSTIKVKTVYGDVEMKVPAGTQSNTTFRLRGKGMPKINSSSKGDELVTVKIVTPKSLNKQQKQALKAFAEASGEEEYKNGGFFEKMKDAMNGKK